MGSAVTASKLFEPLQIGEINLDHRIVMAPLTRYRANADHVPHPYVKEHYKQRVAVPGTLLITEATFISPKATGRYNAPGIWSDAQVAAWKEVTDTVHQAGSFIYLQLWADGRAARPQVKAEEGTGDVVSSSAVPVEEDGHVPRALTEDEIDEYIEAFATGAKSAVHRAGFDGVEIHGANGYLVDQFIQDNANQRTDRWGGSIENRARFALEVTKAVANAVGSDRTAIRLSPWSEVQGMKMKDPVPQFSYVVEELKKLKLAYVHLIESRVFGMFDREEGERNDHFIDILAGTTPVLLAGGFKPDLARQHVDETYKGKDIGIVFGRHFTSNPDLVFRIKNGVKLTDYDRSTFYNAEETKGYNDWPYSEEYVKAHPERI